MKNFFVILFFLSFIHQSAFANISMETFHESIDKQNWDKAIQIADPDLKVLVNWLKLIDEPKPNFYEINKFIIKNPNWPKLEILKRKIEEENLAISKKEDLQKWFTDYPPQTISGMKKLIQISNDQAIIKKYVKNIWQQAYFTDKEEKEFFKQNQNLLVVDDHIKRFNYLCFRKNIEQAARVIKYLPVALHPLYQLRVKIRLENKETLSSIQNKYPKFAVDSGVLLDLAISVDKQKQENDLIKIITIAAESKPNEQYYFWSLKTKLIRGLIGEKDYKTAYLFANSHQQTDVKDASEAEWLAGWIALRFLNEPATAMTHFIKFNQMVKLPISIARGNYWLARAYEQLGQNDNANIWYNKAAQYYTSFYGQVAICKIGNCYAKLPLDPIINQEAKELYNKNILVKAALAIHKTKFSYLINDLLLKAVSLSKNPAEINLITKIGFSIKKDYLSVETAKQASYKNIQIISSGYPVLKSVYAEHDVDRSLVMSIIRQESVFNHQAISSAGAMGLMQLMPFVAKKTAAKIKINYHHNKLIGDPHFNTRLGINHLQELLDKYNNFYPLVIAAYNAGDKPAKQWIENNGDPRSFTDIESVIDWIEKISFHETRNYVQRVLEAKSIYYLLIRNEQYLPIEKNLKAKVLMK